MKRAALVHPFLFTLASILILYENVAIIVSPSQILRPLAWASLLLLLLILPIYRISRSWNLTGLLLTIFVFGFYYWLPLFIIIGATSAITILIWAIYTHFRKRKLQADQITLLLNFVSLAAVLTGIFRILSIFSNVPLQYYQTKIFTNKLDPIAEATTMEFNPDIYYIILDGYAQSDILQDLYGFDNSQFLSYLSSKGFIIPAENRSNYPKTSLSIPSTLNMEYIHVIAPGLENSYLWWLISPLVEYSQARAILEGIGYQTVSINVDWSITNNITTDLYYQPMPIQLSEFEDFIMNLTPLALIRPLVAKVAFIPSFESHRKLVLYNFETLSQLPSSPRSQFVFAHIISPHPPFVFDKNGNPLTPPHYSSFKLIDANDYPGTQEQYRQGYIEQVQFINAQLVNMIDTIIENSETPPIIILQADHGPGMLTDFGSSENTCLKERFSPFAAYFLPGLDEDTIPPNITPVNLFRIIFNEYFGTDLPLLENSYYYYKDTVYIFRSEELSLQRINEPCETQP